MKRIVDLDQDQLKKALDKSNHGQLKLTTAEYGTLRELVNILKPFYKATIDLQGENVPNNFVLIGR